MVRIKLLTVFFEDGEEIVSGFKKVLKEKKVQEAKLVSVEGKIRDVDLDVFVGGAFKTKHLDDEFKLTSMHGSFSEKGNLGFKGELIVSLSDASHQGLGGILQKAKASGEVLFRAEILKFK